MFILLLRYHSFSTTLFLLVSTVANKSNSYIMTNSIFPYNIIVLSNSVGNRRAVNCLSSWKAIGYKLTVFLSEIVNSAYTRAKYTVYAITAALRIRMYICKYGTVQKTRIVVMVQKTNIINNIFILQWQSWRRDILPCSWAVCVLRCPFSMDVTSTTCFTLIRSSFIHSSMALQSFVGPWSLLQFRNVFYTVCRTPWTSDQPVTRPLPKHRISAHNTGIHALNDIRTHDPSVRASEYSSCLSPRSYCDRLIRSLSGRYF
jgi:hypothetical protein